MSIRIGSNIGSLMAQRRLAENTTSVSTTYEKLASGMRINKASDDAAGLAIANKLNADARIFTQAIKNINDGISVTNVAAGALSALGDVLQRQIELAEQSANGVYSLAQRNALDKEAYELTKEYNRIVQSVSFNGISLMNGTGGVTALSIQAGYGSAASVSGNVGTQSTTAKGIGTFAALTGSGTGWYSHRNIGHDINKDGFLDVITGGFSSEIFLGNGNGGYGGSIDLPGYVYSDLAVGDIDGDGDDDFVGVDVYSSNFAVLKNNNLNFTVTQAQALSGVSPMTDPRKIALNDLDGDGDLDMIVYQAVTVSGGGDESLEIWKNDGQGNFSAFQHISEVGYRHADLSIGDLNNDGFTDIVAGGRVFINSGNGSFSDRGTLGYASTGGELLDLNHDGILDYASVNNDNVLRISLGRGDGTFNASVSYALGTINARDIQAGDFNSDGFLDLVIGGYTNNSIVAISNQQGEFSSFTTLGSSGVLVGDFNNDGVADIGTEGGIHFTQTTKNNLQVRLDLMTRQGALTALTSLKAQQERLSNEVGSLGAFQARLEIGSNHLQATRENYKAAESRIRDVDVAEESARLLRSQILQQVATSLLVQANQQPSLVLSLLRNN